MNLPFVSIVIPVYNNLERLKRCVRCLSIMDYPEEKFEVIIVDNGSNNLEQLKWFISDFSFIELFVYTASKSPYPCRNVGVKNAKGSIIALLDSNCFPVQNWLKEGVQSLEDVDMVGGRIIFEFSDQYTTAEIADSLLFADVENAVKSGGFPGGNAFVRKKIFEDYGLFREDIRSNGDAIWSRSVTSVGGRIAYNKDAIVFYPAKKFIPFMKKSFRIGYGSYHFWKFLGHSKKEIRKLNVRSVKPYSKKDILRMIAYRGELDMIKRINLIWFYIWLGNINRFLGRSIAIIFNN